MKKKVNNNPESQNWEGFLKNSGPPSFWRSLIENSPNIIIVVDRQFTIRYLNFSMSEYPAEDALGCDFLDYVLPPFHEIAKKSILQVFDTGKAPRFEALIGLPGRQVYWLEIHQGPVVIDEMTESVALFAIDISKRKSIENKLLELNKSLKEQHNEMDNILNMASHDIKAPLVNIEGFVSEVETILEKLNTMRMEKEGMQKRRKKVDEFFNEDLPVCFKYIHSSIEKIKTLIYSLLNFANIRKKAPAFEDVNLKQLITDIIITLKFRINSYDMEVVYDELKSCRGDVKLLNQLFTNLIDNSIKYRDPDKRGKIVISSEISDNQIIYCVEDNGLGISLDEQNKVFEIFRKVNKQKSGNGVGLSIVKEIAHHHNGRVWVESEVGRGSRFYVALPAMEM